jgi:multiple antibiotic resistance protein
MTIVSAALLLLLVMDPFGNIPFFIAALRNVDRARHTRILIRELVIALLVLVLFLFAGQHILRVLQISEPALTASGGTVLFLIAVRMVFPTPGGPHKVEDLPGEPFVVPLAVPYLAGPSALAAVLLIMNREPERWPAWLCAVFLAWLSTGLIILFSNGLARFLGRKVLIAIERLMGMVLVAIAIQMLMTGIAQFISSTQQARDTGV